MACDCDPIRGVTRRQWLAGATGLGALATLAAARLCGSRLGQCHGRGTARAVILVNLQGAPSHLDTFDVKDAGPGIRPTSACSPAPARSSSPGRYSPVCFGSPPTCCSCAEACRAGKPSTSAASSICRPPIRPIPAFLAESPNIGSVVGLERGGQGPLPPFLSLNGSPDQGAKFLGGKVEPMSAPSNAGGLNTLQHNFFGTRPEPGALREPVQAPARSGQQPARPVAPIRSWPTTASSTPPPKA